MSKLSTIEELKGQAELLGLLGDDVTKFILQQQAVEREERAREREEREKEREEREKERQFELAELQLAWSRRREDLAMNLAFKALLTGFDKIPERYRQEFRGNKIRVSENYRQFATRLLHLFDSWRDSSKIPQTFEGLREFIVLDQFLASLTPDLRLFIKEQEITDLKMAMEKADT
ncbi:hypothetical protein Pcinc_006012 [Petrolisthes cinctipes]|uniref:SCAN box domain-containing protein n=1 Tax=Petrolisthes cinctipes TaxID=88211 RepID=A0AAE1GDS3_PETCI|nr:hypothetical protein Pcinc_006012 [Petrolisthes cinctipes]